MTKKNTKGSSKESERKRRAALDIEVEVKIRCDDVDQLLSSGLTVEIEEDRHLEDNYVFQLPDGKLRKGQYLRIRHTGDGEGSGRRRAGVLTYKGKPRRVASGEGVKHKGKKVREEIETTVGQPPKLVKILKRLGLKRSFRYQKYRTIYRVTLPDGLSLDAMYDETPIGNFLELEGDAAVIEAVAAALGYSQSHFVADSYVEMHMKRCHTRGEEPTSDMLFEATKQRQAKKRERGKQSTAKTSAKARKSADGKAASAGDVASETKPKKSRARTKRKSSKLKASATQALVKSTAKKSASSKSTATAAKPKPRKKKAATSGTAKAKSQAKKVSSAAPAKARKQSKPAAEKAPAAAAPPTSESKAVPKGNGNGGAHPRRKPRAERASVVETPPPAQPLRARARGAAG